jgi:hypothetical protein
LLELLYVAVNVTFVFTPTVEVLMVNVADVWPAGTVTVDVAGVAADGVSLLRETTAPPTGAPALMVTVPVAVKP